jgi:hypothetical protein
LLSSTNNKLNIPNCNDTVIVASAIQSLTNKTINNSFVNKLTVSDNSIYNGQYCLTIPNLNDTFTTNNSIQILYNKTLSKPMITSLTLTDN